MKVCICNGELTCLGCKIRTLVRTQYGCGAMAWLEAIYEAAEASQVTPALKPHRDPLDPASCPLRRPKGDDTPSV